ncbi:MAG TPA: ABATE domain-containing protein [Candidatus Acidoferrum sp.]|jgi:predicted RNA-binding Zn ribbon-like protein|nr:ABATE domain-containing protein [Candidatus Acidoferrum sp.]
MVIDYTMSDASPTKKFQLIGGDLCLDFTNTVGGKRGVIEREHLKTYADVLSWSRQAGIVDDARAERLAKLAADRPSEAGHVLERAVELRETIYRIFAAIVEGRAAADADLARLNSELASALGRLRVRAGADGFDWRWADDEPLLEHPLGPVARAAAELLTDRARPAHVQRCEGDRCGWLFIDSSKNHSRRWCDMRDCGNRAKVRRHRLKQRRDAQD